MPAAPWGAAQWGGCKDCGHSGTESSQAAGRAPYLHVVHCLPQLLQLVS